MNATKKKLSLRVSAKSGIPAYKVQYVIDQIVDSFSEYLKPGNSIEIRGLGTFRVKSRRVRTKPGSPSYEGCKSKLYVQFRAGKKLKESINVK